MMNVFFSVLLPKNLEENIYHLPKSSDIGEQFLTFHVQAWYFVHVANAAYKSRSRLLVDSVGYVAAIRFFWFIAKKKW